MCIPSWAFWKRLHMRSFNMLPIFFFFQRNSSIFYKLVFSIFPQYVKQQNKQTKKQYRWLFPRIHCRDTYNNKLILLLSWRPCHLHWVQEKCSGGKVEGSWEMWMEYDCLTHPTLAIGSAKPSFSSILNAYRKRHYSKRDPRHIWCMRTQDPPKDDLTTVRFLNLPLNSWCLV